MKMKSRIMLVEPNEGIWAPGTYLRHSSVEPLGLGYIGAIAKQEGFDVRIIQQRDSSDEEILRSIKDYMPDIIGFSVMTYNFDAAQNLAKRIKDINPGIHIIFGGSHPTALPEIVKDRNIDFVVIGEGEETFRDLIETIRKKGDFSTVNGIAYYNGKLKITKTRARISNLDFTPWPLRTKQILKECRIFGFNNPPLGKQRSVAQVLFSRGCPYDCVFCCSHRLWGNKVTFRSAKDVANEIKCLESEFDTNYVYFADLLFNSSKKRVVELCDQMIKQGVSSKWFCLCSVKNIDKEIVDAMSKAGCTRIGFGVDSVNNDILRETKPRQKSSLKMAEEALVLSDSVGIINRVFIIIGYPWQNKEDLEATKGILQRLPIDDLRIGILTPLPGSPIYDEYKEKKLITTQDFSKFTTEECVIKLESMTRDELMEIKERMFREFYESEEFTTRLAKKIKRFPVLTEPYKEHEEFLSARNVNIKIS